jgi:hypothetical protein
LERKSENWKLKLLYEFNPKCRRYHDDH